MNYRALHTRVFHICLILFVGLSLTSCFDDTDLEVEETSRPDPKEIVTASIHGLVMDTEGNPAYDATVQVHSASGLVVQDEGILGPGVVFFANIQVPRSVYITVFYEEQIQVRKKLDVIPNQVNFIELHLPDILKHSSFSARTGRTIIHDDWQVGVPGNALQTTSGVPYSGRVVVTTYKSEPNDPNFANTLMGDLSGINKYGEYVALKSYGMISIDVSTEEGEKLELAQGRNARLSLKTTAASPPSEIPLWNLNEQTGDWQQDTSAIYLNIPGIGFSFQGFLNNFGAWNYDVPFVSIDINGKINTTFDNSEAQRIGYYFKIVADNPAFGPRVSYASADGQFQFLRYPQGEQFQLTVYDGCDNLIFDRFYGPFDADVQIDDIEINLNRQHVKLHGKLQDCDDKSIENGFIAVREGISGYFVAPVENGEINLSADLFCLQSEGVEFFFMDEKAQEFTPYFYAQSNNNISQDIGTVSLCQTQVFEYFNYTLEGQPNVYCSDPLVNIQTAPISSNFGCSEFTISVQGLDKNGLYKNEAVDISLTVGSVLYTHVEPANFEVYINRIGVGVDDEFIGTLKGEVREVLGGGVFGAPVGITGSFLIR